MNILLTHVVIERPERPLASAESRRLIGCASRLRDLDSRASVDRFQIGAIGGRSLAVRVALDHARAYLRIYFSESVWYFRDRDHLRANIRRIFVIMRSHVVYDRVISYDVIAPVEDL